MPTISVLLGSNLGFGRGALKPQAFFIPPYVTPILLSGDLSTPIPGPWQKSLPDKQVVFRVEQTWTWRQVHMLGRDVVPGEQSFDLPPKAPQRPHFYSTEWRQVGMLGQDVVPGEQVYDRPTPVQRLPLYTWEWRQVDKLGLDTLPFGDQSYDRPILPIRAGQTWTLNLLETTLAPVVVAGPLGVLSNQYDWPLTRAPGRIDETWVWNQTPMLGQDQLPVGEQIYDLTPKPAPRSPYYGTEWRQVGMLGFDRLPVGDQVTDLTSHRYVAYRIDQTWAWRQVGMLGRDQLPAGDQIYDLSPKAPQRSSYYGTEWRQVQMLGQDQMLVGDQVYDLPNRGIRLAIYDWIQSTNLALLVPPQATLPLTTFSQYDWPLPRAPQQSAPSWTWRQVGMLGLDSLPVGKQVYNLPVRGLRLAIYDWIQSVNLALTVPAEPLLPFNRHDWALPVRGPFQPDRSFTFRSQFIPVVPPPFAGAQYFLLQPHYVNDNWLPAWTTVTEGHEVPVGWIPTLMVDPLNDQAVAAFYAAGPRTGYPGPGYDWQGFNYFTARRTAAIQSPVTHWREVSPGMFELTGLGAALPPVGV